MNTPKWIEKEVERAIKQVTDAILRGIEEAVGEDDGSTNIKDFHYERWAKHRNQLRKEIRKDLGMLNQGKEKK